MQGLKPIARSKTPGPKGLTDIVWVFDGPRERMATISPTEPTDEKMFRPLNALMAHLHADEWDWLKD